MLVDHIQVIFWNRGLPARKRVAGAQPLVLNSVFAPLALIAGETPAVPENHLIDTLWGNCGP
jgi:hypothetical protein